MNEQTTDAEVILSAQHVWKSFDRGAVNVLRGASIRAKAGEMLALWGRSGSGKSTLLHLLGGLDSPDQGELRVCGLDPTQESDRLYLRRHCVGFVFQLHNLIANLTLEENCLMPALAIGMPRPEAKARFEELAQATGLIARRSHAIQKLSGGERQRTALCRALMNKPRVILADEPTGALDEQTGEQVFELLKSLTRQERVTVLMATHERRFAESCDRIYCVRDGQTSPL